MRDKSFGWTASLGQILAKSMTGPQVSSFINMARRRSWASHSNALKRRYCTMWSPLWLLPTPAIRLQMPLSPLLQSLPTQSVGSNGKELGSLPYALLLQAGWCNTTKPSPPPSGSSLSWEIKVPTEPKVPLHPFLMHSLIPSFSLSFLTKHLHSCHCPNLRSNKSVRRRARGRREYNWNAKLFCCMMIWQI